jgi:glycosyltransferase involved in cell wall biosynthesis
MKKNKLVSIVIPFNNRIHMVNEAIDSILNQTYQNWELILINDASFELFELKISDSRIKLLKNEINMGPGGSRQKGIDNATGELFCFLDSDDFYFPNFIEKQYELHEYLDFKICFSYCITKWNNGDLYKNCDKEFNKVLPSLLIENRPWHTSSLMWNKSYLPKWRIDIRTWEDYQFEYDAASINNKIGFVNEVLCNVNLDEELGLSQNSEKISGVTDRLKVLSNMYVQNLESNLEFKAMLNQNIQFRIKKDMNKLAQFDLPKPEYILILNELGLINNQMRKLLLKLIYQKPILSKIIFKYFF